MGKVVCPWDTLINFVTDAFVGYGIPREDAEICTDILLESDRRGIESHGCNRFKPIYLDRIKAGIQNPITNFEVVKEITEYAKEQGEKHGKNFRFTVTTNGILLDDEKKKQMDLCFAAWRIGMQHAGKCGTGAKCLRSHNSANVVAATVAGLKALRNAEQIAAVRGKSAAEIKG